MKLAVINYSGNPKKGRGYNLATEKMKVLFESQGHQVVYSTKADAWTWECAKAYCSTLFTYDLPSLIEDIPGMVGHGLEIEAGGPGVTAMATSIRPEMIALTAWFRSQGVKLCIGLDERFEHVQGNFESTFTSRGCPRACDFCLVSRLEGRKMIEYPEFTIPVGKNPFVCDNNILSTSPGHQRLFVDKLKGVRNLDINSGFDDRIFIKDPEKYWQLYNELDLEAWRFAYDMDDQREVIKACADFLHTKGVDYRHILVFCLVGFPGTSFEYAREKLQFLIDIGTSPYPMRYRPLDVMEMNTVPDGPGWDQKIITKAEFGHKAEKVYPMLDKLFAYYGVAWNWKSCKWNDFVWPQRSRK